MPLRDVDLRCAKPREKPYKISDGRGLHVLVQPTGSRLWRMKYRYNGKEKLLSFGPYPEVSLTNARAKCDEARETLRAGRDPSLYRDQASRAASMSFESVARTWHKRRLANLAPAHASRVLARLERDVFPLMGAHSISTIRAAEILDMLRRVEERGTIDTARRLKQNVSQIFRFAIANDWADSDPSAHLLGALQPLPRRRHMARIGLREMPALLQKIRTYDGEPTARRREATRHALLFTLLTWARTGEVRFATWSEFEGLEEEGGCPLWRVPAERMKMKREHLVPLPRQAVALLRERALVAKGSFVFSGDEPRQPISANTMIYACYRMGYHSRQTVHGFRGLASTWANESGLYRPDWIEAALAHSGGDPVRAAYNSAIYLDDRRRMLQDWADFADDQYEKALNRPEGNSHWRRRVAVMSSARRRAEYRYWEPDHRRRQSHA